MPEAFDVNAYVLTGKGDARKALSGLYFWTWNTEEVLELIEWMRRYNADPSHRRKLKFYGIDMQFAPRAAKVVRSYLQHVDPVLAKRSESVLALLIDPFAEPDYDMLDDERRRAAKMTVDDMVRVLDANRHEYEKKSGAAAFALARQHAAVLRQNLQSREPDGDWRIRDSAMADNVRWILDHEGDDAKVVVWGHNVHVADVDGMMGKHLRETYRARLHSIGFAFNEGMFQAHDAPGPAAKGVQVFTAPAAPAGTFEWMATRPAH